ncbi:O-antigen ligase family protein [Marinitoga litoralis]|uniref:O-antigen ligase family protein n=1 Tax=Marinitoga litoralis TaxID=570855 RepID=UPI001962036E|nr:O-antigen ligase family protein [Marinitoga litoralis]MBM7560132.1 O-antigen ligase [Marinitoga litoralis]
MMNLKDLVVIFYITAFLFSFFNLIPAYPIFIVFGILFLILYIFFPDKIYISRTNKLLYIIGYFYLISAIITGIPFSKFFSYENFRHDGNFYITYMPLFIPILTTNFKSKINYYNLIIKVYKIISLITLGLTFSFLAKKPIGISDGDIYHYLFKAHNAAGGYYLMLSVFGLIYLIHNKSLFNLFYFLSNLAALYFSKSRGSQLAFIWVIGLIVINYSFKSGKLKKIYYIITIIGAITIILTAYYLSTEHGIYNLSTQNTEIMDLNDPNRTANISDRLFILWPRAINDFLKSPILGIGFTRYNDFPYMFEGIRGLLYFNTSRVIFSDAHAHNSYLHVLAETGIIGFIFFIFLIKEMFFISKKIPDKFFSNYVYYSIFAILIAGLTEHRVYTPAQVMPFTILVEVIIYMYYNKIYLED